MLNIIMLNIITAYIINNYNNYIINNYNNYNNYIILNHPQHC